MPGNTENKCPNQYCEVALKLEEIKGEINSQLSRGEQIMKSLKASQEAAFDRFERVFDKQDQRIGAVERKVWYASGVAAGVSAACTAILSNLKALLHWGGSGG